MCNSTALMFALLIPTILVLLVFAIYWFELDEKFLRSFEPTFRKMAGWIKDQNNSRG